MPAEILGAHYQEIEVSAITPNPRQPRRTFDEEALDELAESIRQVGLLQPVVVRAAGPGRYELIMGERRMAGLPAGRADRDRRDRQADPGQRAPPGRPDREPAPSAARPARRGRGVPAAARRLRCHPRGTRAQDRPLPPAHQQYPPAAEPAACRPEAGGGGRAQRRPRPGPAQPGESRSARAPGQPDRGRGPVGPCRRGDRRGRSATIRRRAARPQPAPAATPPASSAWPTASPMLFETRVKVEMGQRKGKIIVEFATPEDLERIVKAMSPDAVRLESAD